MDAKFNDEVSLRKRLRLNLDYVRMNTQRGRKLPPNAVRIVQAELAEIEAARS